MTLKLRKKKANELSSFLISSDGLIHADPPLLSSSKGSRTNSARP